MEIEKRVDEYIANQHCVLWGTYFDITSKEGPNQAKQFIIDLLIDLGISNELLEEDKC